MDVPQRFCHRFHGFHGLPERFNGFREQIERIAGSRKDLPWDHAGMTIETRQSVPKISEICRRSVAESPLPQYDASPNDAFPLREGALPIEYKGQTAQSP